MKIFYTDTYKIPLPAKHSFPKDKYYLLRKRIEDAGIVPPENLIVPEPASEADILRVHDTVYWNRLKNGELTAKEIRRVGLPWSPEIVRRARYSTGATIAACRRALSEKIAVNLGGGGCPARVQVRNFRSRLLLLRAAQGDEQRGCDGRARMGR